MELTSLRQTLQAQARKRPILSVCLLFLAAYALYQIVTTFFVWCRDAYVTTDIVFVAPEINGPVSRLLVADNQFVEKGAPLFTIDSRPFEIVRDSQQAALSSATDNLKKAQDQLALTAGEIDAKKATFQNALTERDRTVKLSNDGVVSAQVLGEATRNYEVALADLNISKGERAVALQEITVQTSLIAKARAELAQAEYDIACTTVHAPVAGRVAPLKIRAGQYLQTGVAAAVIVSKEDWRVVMNLPQRYLSGLQPGQKVWFTVGSNPWRLHRGAIRSISPGVSRSENAPAVLPYVDPSVDWIRLPRRFPVEIDMGDLPQREQQYQGADATVWMFKW